MSNNTSNDEYTLDDGNALDVVLKKKTAESFTRRNYQFL